jgi:hypothetical protein
MMLPEQRAVVAQAWVKGLLKAIKKNPDEKHQKYFHSVMDFIDNPTEKLPQSAEIFCQAMTCISSSTHLSSGQSMLRT